MLWGVQAWPHWSHQWHSKVCLLQCGTILSYIPSEIQLLQHRYFGCPAPTLTHSLVRVSSTQAVTRIPASPLQQHRNSSDALAISQLRLLSKCSQAQQNKMISSTASSESRKQPLTSTRLWYTVRQASLMASTEACPLIAKQQKQLQIQSSTF